ISASLKRTKLPARSASRERPGATRPSAACRDRSPWETGRPRASRMPPFAGHMLLEVRQEFGGDEQVLDQPAGPGPELILLVAWASVRGGTGGQAASDGEIPVQGRLSRQFDHGA